MDKPLNPSQVHEAVAQLVRDEPVMVKINGECMLPWIEDGASVTVSPARFYWPGDVVVFLSSKDQYLVHRVIGLYRRSGKLKVLTQPDASQRPDAAMTPSAILGKVTAGDCHPHAYNVLLSHRLKALYRFVRFSVPYALNNKT